MPAVALIALGANLGDRAATLEAALATLGALPESRLLRVSSFHETPPVGPGPQGPFLNAAAALETGLDPRVLLAAMLGIERSFGRLRRIRWGPRTLDLDLLAYDDLVIAEPDLTVPHPCLHERDFVLAPLLEVAPDWVHPLLGRDVRTLLADLR